MNWLILAVTFGAGGAVGFVIGVFLSLDHSDDNGRTIL